MQDEQATDKQGEQAGGNPSGRLLDAGVGCAGNIAQQRESDAPDNTAGCVENEEAAVGQLGQTGQAGHDRTQEGGETTDEDRPPPASPEVGTGAVDSRAAMP